MQGGPTHRRRFLWTVVIFAGMWLLLFRALAVHWSSSQQYLYAWLVPFLALYAAFARSKMVPPRGPRLRSGLWIGGIAALLFVPTWIVFQPNPDWRLLSWILTAEVVIVTLGAIAGTGGAAWAKHFAFPCLFVFTAVPWPRPLEIPLIERLTRGVTWMSVEVLNLAGVRAIQDGNIIEMRAGQLGIEEACSGIQSLQTALMMSLFFGEFFRLHRTSRIALVFFGLGCALVTNVGRTSFLAMMAARDGIAAVPAWHDPAANVALLACLIAIWGVGSLISAKPEFHTTDGAETAALAQLAPRFLGTVGICVLGAVAIAEVWFHDRQAHQGPWWSLIAPAESTPVAIPEQVAKELRADETVSVKWTDLEGRQVQLYFFRWKPGPPRARLLARLHQPDRCLPATGLKLLEERGQVVAGSPALPLTFRAWKFGHPSTPLYVYSGIWENRSQRALAQGEFSDSLTAAAFQSVLWRERNLGQQVAELALFGYSSEVEADAAFQSILRRLLVQNAVVPAS